MTHDGGRAENVDHTLFYLIRDQGAGAAGLYPLRVCVKTCNGLGASGISDVPEVALPDFEGKCSTEIIPLLQLTISRNAQDGSVRLDAPSRRGRPLTLARAPMSMLAQSADRGPV